MLRFEVGVDVEVEVEVEVDVEEFGGVEKVLVIKVTCIIMKCIDIHRSNGCADVA